MWLEKRGTLLSVSLMFFSCCSPPIDDFDVFRECKDKNFFESQESISILCTHLQQLTRSIEDLDENQLKSEFFKLLQVKIR
jgi:hypothetical protein